MGLPPLVFWMMSLKEFKLAQRGFFEKTKQERQLKWEAARYIAFNTLVPHAKKGRLRNPKDLGLFEWEKDIEIETGMTDEQVRYWILKLGMFKDKDGKGYNA